MDDTQVWSRALPRPGPIRVRALRMCGQQARRRCAGASVCTCPNVRARGHALYMRAAARMRCQSIIYVCAASEGGRKVRGGAKRGARLGEVRGCRLHMHSALQQGL